MKFSTKSLIASLFVSAVCSHRLLESQYETVQRVVYVPAPEQEDNNPDLDVMIPEEAYEEPPQEMIEQIIEERVAQPEPAQVAAVLVLTPEQAEQLNLQDLEINVNQVGTSMD